MNRSEFIMNSSALVTGIALDRSFGWLKNEKRIKKFGIQLYTLRDVIPKDPKGVLKQLASFGYKQIESYEGSDGMFWGMGYLGFRQYMEELGMSMIASHCDVKKDFAKKIDEAAAIGMKYLICPWVGPQKSMDEFKKIAEQFNVYGQQCKNAGIRFAYHNHDYSFKPVDGQVPQEVLMRNTDPSLVDFEMDIYWVVTGGHDPIKWLKDYPNRFRCCHVKDKAKNPGSENNKNSVDLGTGSIDFKKVLDVAHENGMQYYFVEQEYYPNGSSLEAAKTDAAFMKQLKF